jgi:Cu-Zn family superoxide dismutase
MAKRPNLVLLTVLLFAASSTPRAAPAADAGQPAPPSQSVVSALKDRQGRPVGTVTLTETPHGLLVRGTVEGLHPGPHAIHFHETGKCEPPFTSAGGHFNPSQKTHGVLSPGGPHGGDLPNLVVPASGKLDFETFAPGLSLSSGPGAVLDSDGTAIVVHAKADDHVSQPAGDSGDRIACGVLSR